MEIREVVELDYSVWTVHYPGELQYWFNELLMSKEIVKKFYQRILANRRLNLHEVADTIEVPNKTVPNIIRNKFCIAMLAYCYDRSSRLKAGTVDKKMIKIQSCFKDCSYNSVRWRAYDYVFCDARVVLFIYIHRVVKYWTNTYSHLSRPQLAKKMVLLR